MSTLAPPLVGLIPAAGFATRLGAQPSSKEALPIAGRPLISHLLQRFALAGVESAVLVLRYGKDDVVEALRQFANYGIQVEILWTEQTASVPHTLDLAHDRLLARRVVLGFPDILFEPRDAYAALDERQQETGADLVLGLFPTKFPGVTDMVELDEKGRPVDIVIKQEDCALAYTWQIAVWTETVTRYLRTCLIGGAAQDTSELYLGDLLRRGITGGLKVEAVVFESGRCLDVGVPEALKFARSLRGDLGSI